MDRPIMLEVPGALETWIHGTGWAQGEDVHDDPYAAELVACWADRTYHKRGKGRTIRVELTQRAAEALYDCADDCVCANQDVTGEDRRWVAAEVRAARQVMSRLESEGIRPHHGSTYR